MSDVDFELFEKILRDARGGIHRVEKRVISLEEKVHEGFASSRAHDYSHHSDMAMMERRVADLETQIERLSTAQGINQND